MTAKTNTAANVAEPPPLGIAANGYPVFGQPYHSNGMNRPARSSFWLHAGTRPGCMNDHWGSADLDECNGMMWKGSYGYYIVDENPWVLACYKGSPDPSFDKSAGGEENQGGMMPPPPGSP